MLGIFLFTFGVVLLY